MTAIPTSQQQRSTAGEHSVCLEGSVPYFDVVSADYSRRYFEQSPGGYAFRVRKQRVLEMLDRRGGKVLDVGCGPGIMVRDLINLGYEFWGIDASSRMIDECHNNFEEINQAHFLVGNATRIDFPDQYFDTVICTGVIDHIQAYELALKEMLRVLKKDGSLLIAFPNLHSPSAAWRNFVFYPIVRLLRPVYYRLLGRPQPPALASVAKLYSEKNAIRLLKKYNGEVTNVAYYNFNQLLSPLDEVFPNSAIWFAERLEPRRSGRSRWLGAGFILRARKA